MPYIRVNYDRDVYVTREGDPEDHWDRDDTAADISINSIQIVTDKNYHDIAVSFEIDPSKIYFLLWADYDTRDSFGNDCNQVEFIDLFATEEKALAAQKILNRNDYDKWSSEAHSGEYIREDGQSIKLYKPWIGYFENLNSINIDGVRVKNDR